jgi:hypothetical protein
MRKFYIAIILLICSVAAEAQGTETKLNQAELIKQLAGIWKCDIGKDTIATWSMIPYGSGLDASLKYVSKGKIIKEGIGVYGYDKSINKCAEAGIIIGKDIGVYAFWFVSEKKYVLIPYADLSDPEKASFKMEVEFKSSDLQVETTFIDNKLLNIKTWTKSK